MHLIRLGILIIAIAISISRSLRIQFFLHLRHLENIIFLEIEQCFYDMDFSFVFRKLNFDKYTKFIKDPKIFICPRMCGAKVL